MLTQFSIFLDTRRKKDNDVYPVKLRVWNPLVKKAKMYKINMDLTEQEYKWCWDTKKPRKDYRENRIIIEEVLTNAKAIARQLSPFSFQEFEQRLFRNSGDGTNIFWHYDNVIQRKNKNNEVSTALSYQHSLQSLKSFLDHNGYKNAERLSFYEVNKDWLNNYEKYMTNVLNRSLTTVGIYLRNLRAIFNLAIEENEIEKEIYPFGKRKYQIPAPRNVKKALSNEQLKILFESKPETPEQQKAKDFFFFSYACNGMNIKDIALMKRKDIKDDSITFYRAKTINTTKANLKPIKAYLNDFTMEIIDMYGNQRKGSNQLVFDIISDNLNAAEQKNKINNFTRFVNQHLKALAESIGLPKEISTYWARHSFATNSIRKGASMEFIQESLGHGNLNTTMSYFAGFDDDRKKEFAQHLMDF